MSTSATHAEKSLLKALKKFSGTPYGAAVWWIRAAKEIVDI
jgi:hypothetical protein